MYITPSGKSKRMEQQSYAETSSINSLIEKIAGTLDIDPGGVSAPATKRPMDTSTNETTTTNPQDEGVTAHPDLQNAMNQGTTLPPDQDPNQTQSGRFENKVNQVAQDVLSSLDLDPSQWTTNTNVSSGPGGEVATISINLKRSAKTGPEIQKP